MKAAGKAWFAAFGNQSFPVIGFNTGASWPAKRWTPSDFAEVADSLLERGFGIAFFGGPVDRENVRKIIKLMKHGEHPRLAVFTGKTTLLELAALIRKCSVFLANDSGPTHVAVSQKTTNITPEIVLNQVLACAGNYPLPFQPAVFFDRDGVLNIDKNYLYRREDLEWISGAIEAIKFFNDKGYYTFVVTNQSGVARGLYKEKDVRALHEWMNKGLSQYRAHIDAFYYCPHHPVEGQNHYRRECDCRKPGPGLILKAMREWPVDKEKSLLIGDRESDLEAARAAGIKGYLFGGEGQNLLEFIKTRIFG